MLTRPSPWQREVDRNQELLTRIRQLQDREAEAEAKMKEQLEHNRQSKQSLDAANKRLREKEDGLAEAGEVRALWASVLCPRSSLCRRSRAADSPPVTMTSGRWDCFLSVSDASAFYTHPVHGHV